MRRAAAATKAWLAALAIVFANANANANAASARADDPRDIPLVDQNGIRFRLRDLAGEPVALTFVASRCSDACPIADAEFALLRGRLDRARTNARLVTITLDPDYDTPFVFAKLARAYRAPNDDRWRFASGRPGDVRRVMRAFGVTASAGRNGVPDVHATFVYILGRDVTLKKTLLLSTTLPAVVDATLRTV
ncbi:MAG: hypothetical protein NVS3B16_26830 [Vulcanimicrobiaceae bacterium]